MHQSTRRTMNNQNSNDLNEIITHVFEEMKFEAADSFVFQKINLAELELYSQESRPLKKGIQTIGKLMSEERRQLEIEIDLYRESFPELNGICRDKGTT